MEIESTMPENEHNDLLTNRVSRFLFWQLPWLAFIVGLFVGPLLRTFLWTGAFTIAGLACLKNALQCGRVHCYFTGPFYLLMAAISFAYGVGLLSFGSDGWGNIAISVLFGALILRYVPERIMGQYV